MKVVYLCLMKACDPGFKRHRSHLRCIPSGVEALTCLPVFPESQPTSGVDANIYSFNAHEETELHFLEMCVCLR
ncbi:hypothetical protein U0070_017365 [Myodes glareolus]|uniref:Uncharacterized protein n=1 Tax=Myodes glareolus TaxID=447135 RepID=A0AAW0K488_MYOGA